MPTDLRHKYAINGNPEALAAELGDRFRRGITTSLFNSNPGATRVEMLSPTGLTVLGHDDSEPIEIVIALGASGSSMVAIQFETKLPLGAVKRPLGRGALYGELDLAWGEIVRSLSSTSDGKDQPSTDRRDGPSDTAMPTRTWVLAGISLSAIIASMLGGRRWVKRRQ